MSIALPADIAAQPHPALTTMVGGFLPLVQYRGSAGASYKHRDEPEFQVYLLTPRTSDSEDPIRIPNLDVALQSLRFMEFSLEDVQQTTLFDPTGRSVVVNLPAPQRYAVHKLLIVGERAGVFKAKVSKDVAQAAALMGCFLANDPDAAKRLGLMRWGGGAGDCARPQGNLRRTLLRQSLGAGGMNFGTRD